MSDDRNASEDLHELLELWHRWSSVVFHFSQSRKSSKPISSSDYSELHKSLMQISQKVLRDADESISPAVENLKNLASPWVNLEAIAVVGQNNAIQLYKKCRDIDSLFSNLPIDFRPSRKTKTYAGNQMNWKLLLITFIVSVGLGVLVMNSDGISTDGRSLWDPQLWMVFVKYKVNHLGFFKVFSAVTVFVVVVGGLTLYATKKS